MIVPPHQTLLPPAVAPSEQPRLTRNWGVVASKETGNSSATKLEDGRVDTGAARVSPLLLVLFLCRLLPSLLFPPSFPPPSLPLRRHSCYSPAVLSHPSYPFHPSFFPSSLPFPVSPPASPLICRVPFRVDEPWRGISLLLAVVIDAIFW